MSVYAHAEPTQDEESYEMIKQHLAQHETHVQSSWTMSHYAINQPVILSQPQPVYFKLVPMDGSLVHPRQTFTRAKPPLPGIPSENAPLDYNASRYQDMDVANLKQYGYTNKSSDKGNYPVFTGTEERVVLDRVTSTLYTEKKIVDVVKKDVEVETEITGTDMDRLQVRLSELHKVIKNSQLKLKSDGKISDVNTIEWWKIDEDKSDILVSCKNEIEELQGAIQHIKNIHERECERYQNQEVLLQGKIKDLERRIQDSANVTTEYLKQTIEPDRDNVNLETEIEHLKKVRDSLQEQNHKFELQVLKLEARLNEIKSELDQLKIENATKERIDDSALISSNNNNQLQDGYTQTEVRNDLPQYDPEMEHKYMELRISFSKLQDKCYELEKWNESLTMNENIRRVKEGLELDSERKATQQVNTEQEKLIEDMATQMIRYQGMHEQAELKVETLTRQLSEVLAQADKLKLDEESAEKRASDFERKYNKTNNKLEKRKSSANENYTNQTNSIIAKIGKTHKGTQTSKKNTTEEDTDPESDTEYVSQIYTDLNIRYLVLENNYKELEKKSKDLEEKNSKLKKQNTKHKNRISELTSKKNEEDTQSAGPKKDYENLLKAAQGRIDELEQLHNEKDEGLEDLSQRLAKEISNKLSANETSLENVSVKNRPMNVAADYELLCCNEWLAAKTYLDEEAEMAEEQKLRILYLVLCEAESQTSSLLESWWSRFHTLFTYPECALDNSETNIRNTVFSGGDSARPLVTPQVSLVPRQVIAMVSDALRLSAENIDLGRIVEKIKSKLLTEEDKCGKYLQVALNNPVTKYIVACVRLTWKMAIQKPAMTFQQSGIGDPWQGEQRQDPHWGSSDPQDPESVVLYYVVPMLYHGEALMVKGKVYLAKKKNKTFVY